MLISPHAHVNVSKELYKALHLMPLVGDLPTRTRITSIFRLISKEDLSTIEQGVHRFIASVSSPKEMHKALTSSEATDRQDNIRFEALALNRFLFEVPINTPFDGGKPLGWEAKKAPFPWKLEKDGHLVLVGLPYGLYAPGPGCEDELREFARKYKRRINP